MGARDPSFTFGVDSLAGDSAPDSFSQTDAENPQAVPGTLNLEESRAHGSSIILKSQDVCYEVRLRFTE